MNRTFKAALLLFFVSLCVAAVFVTRHVRSHVPAPVPHELFAVVQKQLAAFRAQDYPGAYLHAASGVQQKFTLPQFEGMIRRNYAEMTLRGRVEFGPVESNEATAVVQVFFFGERGTVRPYLYNLSAEGDGWKVDGVQAMRASGNADRLPGLNL